VTGLRVGHWTHPAGATGCTVILCTGGAVAGVDVRGGAPGTRETDLLRPENRVEQVHGIVLAGGSAFGLAAADGVLQRLEAVGVGYDTGIAHVPIVPAAVVFDLGVANPATRPSAQSGLFACDEALSPAGAGAVAQGNVGAGTGATVGKALGLGHACKGGLGSASRALESGLVVGALAVVNAFGSVVNPSNGETVAGVRRLDDDGHFAGWEDPVACLAARGRPEFRSSNTTLGVVATNAALGKAEVTRVAQMAQDALARTIRPVHTGIDGDVVFALALGNANAPECPDASCDLVGVLAADVLAQAILNAVLAAEDAYGLPAARSLAALAQK
jgi:L-aminopeptidase/D-esterase-like protein